MDGSRFMLLDNGPQWPLKTEKEHIEPLSQNS